MSGRVQLVVPCFNEADRLDRKALVSFVRSEPDVDFVVVDDGSTDGTAEILAGLVRDEPERFRLVRLDRNRGKAEAVRQGMLAAFAADPELVGYWDADLAAPLDEIAHLREALERNPTLLLALGSRVRLLGREIHRSPIRHYVGRIFATLASLTLELPVYDSQCGAKLFRNTREVRALFEEEFTVGWTFDVEILARLVTARGSTPAEAARCALEEVPLRSWRDPGASKVRTLDFFRAVAELARIRRHYFAPARKPA